MASAWVRESTGFGESVYGKLEYRYSRYGKFKPADDLAAELGETGASEIDLDRHQLVVALGRRF